MSQPKLFDDSPKIESPSIPELSYLPGFLSVVEQHECLDVIDGFPWDLTLSRRVQHYGYRYDYKSRSVDPSNYLGPLPDFALMIASRLLSDGHVRLLSDQLIVNEYLPGQGIAAHIDCIPCFEDQIASISLGSTCEMDFINLSNGDVRSMMLKPGSLLILDGEARFQWAHRIRARKSDRGIRRHRRVSLTFRKVRLSYPDT